MVFLGFLLLLLLLAVVFSLIAGSYDTPVLELIQAVFGKAADNKINIIVRGNRPPRILTAVIAGEPSLVFPDASYRPFCAIHWHPRQPSAFRRGHLRRCF